MPSLSNTSFSPTYFIVLLVAGFLVGVFGHVIQQRAVVAVGVTLVFVGGFLLVFVTLVLGSP